jgi:transcriptional regulator with XRE-family HTH domain
MRARYDLRMTGRDVDRAEWAKIVRELLDQHTRGKKAPLARRLGISEKTIDRWLDGTVRVSEESVYKVAAEFDLNPVDLLMLLGLVTRDEIPVYPSAVIDDEQRRVIDRDDLDAEQKAYILAELEKMRATDEELLAAQRERDRRTREERVDGLIERISRTA